MPDQPTTAALVVAAFDDYGTPLCPLTRTERSYDDAGDRIVYREVPCCEELRLVVRLSICPGKGDPDVSRAAFVNANANTSSWEYVCLDPIYLALLAAADKISKGAAAQRKLNKSLSSQIITGAMEGAAADGRR